MSKRRSPTDPRPAWTGAVALGPFRLVAHVASGGYAHVFRGVHAGLGVPVAVKVLKLEPERAGALMETFRDELAAMADLDHPHVAAVFDQGLVGEAATRAVPELLAPGDPYLVMEWASGGSLAGRPHAASFTELRAMLLALLDALGHVHARGVVHRDVKPANVLLCTERDPRPGPKLADFGISRRWERPTGPLGRTVGTPQYMAPEQITGATLDEGPWTDLYALGCLAYRLTCGHTPFHELSLELVARAHLVATVPPLAPRFPVPEGYFEWLGALLAKAPYQRPACAAEAADALERLGGRRSRAARPVPTPAPSDPASSEITLDLTVPIDGRVPSDEARPGGRRPIRASWRAAAERPPTWARGLRARSASLVGLRSPALVGRERERDALWRGLVAVHQGGASRAVLLEGPAGIGKTRLATWLARRALEEGAAIALRADPWSGGLLGALARHLGVEGLSRESVADRLPRALERSALARSDVAPCSSGSRPPRTDAARARPRRARGWSSRGVASARSPRATP